MDSKGKKFEIKKKKKIITFSIALKTISSIRGLCTSYQPPKIKILSKTTRQLILKFSTS
jgi:hypothetical protein